jgi:hypothetical protein
LLVFLTTYWQGIGPDYYEFTPLIARRLHPFPDSPLRSKCPDMPPHELVCVFSDFTG